MTKRGACLARGLSREVQYYYDNVSWSLEAGIRQFSGRCEAETRAGNQCRRSAVAAHKDRVLCDQHHPDPSAFYAAARVVAERACDAFRDSEGR